MFTRSARNARLLPLLGILVLAIGACGAPGATGGPSTAAQASTQSGATAPLPTTVPSATSMPPPGATASPGNGPASTLAPGTAGSPGPIVVTGQVMEIYSTGDFILNVGAVNYTVVMSLTASVVNLRGREIPRQYIQVSGSAQVTGTLAGLNIAAQTVLVPTSKDGP